MKIKTDFVTNSSSSSFIVAFPNKIKTVEDVEKYMASRYAKTVFKDAMSQKPLSLKSPITAKIVSKELTNGSVSDPRIDFPWDGDRTFVEREGGDKNALRDTQLWRSIYWDERRLKENAAANVITDEFMEKLPNGSYIYIFNYGDEDGEYYSELEHNDIFRKVPSIRVSKH